LKKKTVLFICTHNSARSQIAEALTNHFWKDNLYAESAGTIATEVNPYVIKVLNSLGINTKNLYSKSIEKFANEKFDLVITVCDHAKEVCPFFPANNVLHKNFYDPSSTKGTETDKFNAFTATLNEIFQWLKEIFGEPIQK